MKDESGWTALYWASINCHVEAVGTLVNAGADVSVAYNGTAMPDDEICKHGDDDDEVKNKDAIRDLLKG